MLRETVSVRRQLNLPGWTRTHQEKIFRSRILVAGIGGIGGAVAEYLAMAGVRDMTIVHEGILESDDLNRQTLMNARAIGQSRVVVARERLEEQFPGIRITALDRPVDESLIPFLEKTDVVIDARIHFRERFRLNAYLCRLGKNFVEAAMYGTEGVLLPVRPRKTACFRCVFSQGDPDWEPLNFPVFGAISGTIGSMAAFEAIKFASGYGTPQTGFLTYYDGLDMTLRSFSTRRVRGCPDCGCDPEKSLLEIWEGK